MNYSKIENFIIDSTEYLADYDLEPFTQLHPQNRNQTNKQLSQFSEMCRGYLKSTDQAVKVFKQRFPISEVSIKSFLLLQKALEDEIILADNVFISEEDELLFVYMILPCDETPSSRFSCLEKSLESKSWDFNKSKLIFFQLLNLIMRLHNLGVCHGGLSGKTVWLRDEEYVMLAPFELGNEDEVRQFQCDSYSLLYKAPEQLFSDSPINQLTPESDVWSLGCLFAEIFFTRSPLFLSESLESFVTEIDEQIGIPPAEELKRLGLGLLETILRNGGRSGRGKRGVFMEKLNLNARQLFAGMMRFEASKRINIDRIRNHPFFESSQLNARAITPRRAFQSSRNSNRKRNDLELFEDRNISSIHEVGNTSVMSLESLDKETARFQAKSSKQKPKLVYEFLDESIKEPIFNFQCNDSSSKEKMIGQRVNSQSSEFRDTIPKTMEFALKEKLERLKSALPIPRPCSNSANSMFIFILDCSPISLRRNTEVIWRLIADGRILFESRKIEFNEMRNISIPIPQSNSKNGKFHNYEFNSLRIEIQLFGENLIGDALIDTRRLPLVQWISICSKESNEREIIAKIKFLLKRNNLNKSIISNSVTDSTLGFSQFTSESIPFQKSKFIHQNFNSTLQINHQKSQFSAIISDLNELDSILQKKAWILDQKENFNFLSNFH